LVTDQIKDDIDNYDEVEDSTLFHLKSEKLAKAPTLMYPAEKMSLLMKYQDAMSMKEIQEVLEVGETAAKIRVKKAKAVKIYNEM
jgi:DNA-directed RNA polymerase specialized sigma24 family protein